MGRYETSFLIALIPLHRGSWSRRRSRDAIARLPNPQSGSRIVAIIGDVTPSPLIVPQIELPPDLTSQNSNRSSFGFPRWWEGRERDECLDEWRAEIIYALHKYAEITCSAQICNIIYRVHGQGYAHGQDEEASYCNYAIWPGRARASNNVERLCRNRNVMRICNVTRQSVCQL